MKVYTLRDKQIYLEEGEAEGDEQDKQKKAKTKPYDADIDNYDNARGNALYGNRHLFPESFLLWHNGGWGKRRRLRCQGGRSENQQED